MPTGRPAGRPATVSPTQNKITKIPSAPKHLAADGKAAWTQIWKSNADYLDADKDVYIVTRISEATDELMRIVKALSDGTVPRTYNNHNTGQIITHPYVTQATALRTQITAWMSQIGMSPTDRSKLGIGEKTPEDPFAELKKRQEERRLQQLTEKEEVDE